MRLVQGAKVIGSFRRGHALQDTLGHFQHGDVEVELARDRGRLQADIAAADDQQAAPGAKLLRHAIDVADAAQGEYAVERAADGIGQGARARAGGEQQLVVFDRLAGAGDDLPMGAVDGFDAGIEAQRDVVLLVPFQRTNEQALALEITEQVLLRQRRALVGGMRFLADQQQRLLVAERHVP